MNIAKQIGTPAVLEQTAEECIELANTIDALLHMAYASLKEARRLRGENPTLATEVECRAAIREEMANVSVCLGQLNEIGYPIDMVAVRDKIEKLEYRIGERNAGKAANRPKDGVLGAKESSYISGMINASDDDLIRRGDALAAIRKACILGHLPWKSSSTQGRTTLEALAAIRLVQKV